MNKEEKLFWDFLRMCNSYQICEGCPIKNTKLIAKSNMNCREWAFKNFDESVKIIKKWANEQPEKTLLSDFKEKYPNTPLSDSGCPEELCPHDLGYNDSLTLKGNCIGGCKKCWDIPLNEVELCAQD